MTGIRIRITGVVQGVGFRWFVQRTAVTYDLTGWVRNDSDGSVVCEAFGDPGFLKEFLRNLRAGNAASSVSGVQEEALVTDEVPASFEIRW